MLCNSFDFFWICIDSRLCKFVKCMCARCDSITFIDLLQLIVSMRQVKKKNFQKLTLQKAKGNCCAASECGLLRPNNSEISFLLNTILHINLQLWRSGAETKAKEENNKKKKHNNLQINKLKVKREWKFIEGFDQQMLSNSLKIPVFVGNKIKWNHLQYLNECFECFFSSGG